MKRMCCLAFAALFAGCDTTPPPPIAAPPPATVSASAAAPEQAQPVPQPAASTQAEPEETSPPAAAAAPAQPIRALALGLLRPDGQGGWQVDEEAARQLEQLTAEQARELWTLFTDESPEVRRGAAYFRLATFNPADKQQVAAFAALLDDSDQTVRGFGLSAVKQMHQADQVAAVSRLANMLSPDQEARAENRAAIIRLLSGLKLAANEAFEQIAESAAQDPDAKVRAAALAALAQIDSPERSLEIFTKALDDSESSVRLVAAAKLRQLGPLAASAAPTLAARLADEESRVAETAAEALIAIGKPSVEPLTGVLGQSNVEAKKLALACLAKLGPAAKEALPAIEKCKTDEDALVRQLAEAALKAAGGEQRAAMP